MYDCEVGKFIQVDPLSFSTPSWTPYRYAYSNPLTFIDPSGNLESTHTDKDGNVIAVYDDGDNNVYKHDISKDDYKGEVLNGKNGTKMGKTEYWDEFARHNSKGEILKGRGKDNYANPTAHINFGKSIDAAMIAAHEYAKKGMNNSKVGVLWLKEHSGNGQDLDIKTKLGEEQGYLFQGSYISGESAGNYLFGKNLAYSGNAGFSKGDYWDLSAQQFGAYHNKQNNVNNPKVKPYYGEIPYSGRQIAKGFWGGKGFTSPSSIYGIKN